MTPKREIRRLPTRQNISEIKFSGSNFSRRRVEREIEKLRTRYPNKRYQVLLPYENWKPGSWFGDGQEISLFSLSDHYDESQIPEGGGDPGTYNQFIIYITDPVALAGGCSPKNDRCGASFLRNNGLNDCLYQCLYYAYGTFSKMPKLIEKPDILKRALGLQRTDPVPVNYIEKVERLARSIAINITGDVTRISKSPAHRKITLTLANGHYSLVPNPDRRRTDPGTTKLKKPLIYQEGGVNNIVKIYDGKYTRSITVPEMRKLQSKSLFGKCCYIPVTKNKDTLEDAYERIYEERNILLEESKKLGLSIDLFMYHGSYKKVALWLFERLSQSIPANKPLDPIEAKWISDTMMGGIIWADNDWNGYGRQYDETSLYPSIMQSAVAFPISKGKFQILKDFVKKRENRDYAMYGLYRAEVEYKEDMKVLFRYNKHNKYTHIDLSHARKLGLQVTLIQDNNPNALVYEKETRIPGNVIFGEYVHFLFKLKNIGGIVGRVAKRILNTLWGALCQRNKSYHDISDAEHSSKPFEFPEGEVLDSITPTGDAQAHRRLSESWVFQFSKPGNLFKGEYPRIAPFILAQGRKIISETIEPYKEKVKRVHTDGFILEEDLTKPHLIDCPEDASKSLKALKFEKEGMCHVKNANQVIWL